MNEEEKVKKQLLKNMLLNLITFSIIFYILGLIIYSQFNSSLYISADTELKNVTKQIQRPYLANDDFEEKPVVEEEEKKIAKRYDESNANEQDNPRLVFINRDESGNVIEDDGINDKLNDIFKEVEFSKALTDTIYEIDVNGYSYRGINYETSDGNYKQVLINVDSEKDIAQKFVKNLTISFMISIIVIVIASYVLSKKSLKPIVQSWKKQTKFVQDASHELRTPLAIIKAKQETLLENPETKIIDNVEDISISLQETQRLTKLIKELMELASNDSNKLKLNKEKFNLDNELNSIIALYGEVAKSEGKTVKLDLGYNEDIIADSSKIKELLIILLDNSIKYTEKNDEIEVKTYKKDNKCFLEVIDTGIGISKEAMEHIFERFYREEKSRNRSKGGMGLGLSIAYNIVELHKGTIKFDKNREKGTRVIVKLPIK